MFAGNLTRDRDGYEYEYDYENRIVKITKDSSDIAEFAYDALGRRISKIDSAAGETTLYYYNHNWQVLAEYDGANNLQRKFIYGNYIDEVLLMKADGNDYYYAHDHLYSPAALIDSSGTVLERYEYDAYGNCSILEPNFAPDPDGKSDYGNPYLFTGRRVDIMDNNSLKIQYNRNRYYDYYTGRFITNDPLAIVPNSLASNFFMPPQQYSEGMSLYQYVLSNPVIGIDPWGLVEYRKNGPVPPWPKYPKMPQAPWWLPGPRRKLRAVQIALVTLAGVWEVQGHHDGAAFLLHWLGNTGWGKVADYSRMLRDSVKARDYFMVELRQAQDAAEFLVNVSRPVATQITSIKRDKTGPIPPSDSFNWYAAVGKHYTWGRGNVRKGKGRKNCCYYMDLTIHMCDIYNFDIREIKDVLVIPPWLLEYYGWAKSYRVVGKHKINVTWIKGYRGHLDEPLAVIEGRQKPFPQCQ